MRLTKLRATDLVFTYLASCILFCKSVRAESRTLAAIPSGLVFACDELHIY